MTSARPDFGLIIVGDEILSGKRTDKHLPKVIELLGARGLQLAWAEYVGDSRDRITAALRRAFTSDEDEKVRANRIIETTKQLLQGKRQVLIDLGKESRHNRRLKPFSLPASVEVSNTLSEKFTVIEVMGLDRTGLLHQLTRAISDLNLTIGSAHIGTYGEKAVDVFYVTDLTGHKIDAKSRQLKIRDALLGVFSPLGEKGEKKVVNG